MTRSFLSGARRFKSPLLQARPSHLCRKTQTPSSASSVNISGPQLTVLLLDKIGAVLTRLLVNLAAQKELRAGRFWRSLIASGLAGFHEKPLEFYAKKVVVTRADVSNFTGVFSFQDVRPSRPLNLSPVVQAQVLGLGQIASR